VKGRREEGERRKEEGGRRKERALNAQRSTLNAQVASRRDARTTGDEAFAGRDCGLAVQPLDMKWVMAGQADACPSRCSARVGTSQW